MQTTLRETLVELGYELSHFGLLAASVDGVLTEDERIAVADTLDGGNSTAPAPQPVPFKCAKFERALDRFSIASLGETEAEAYRRFHFTTERLHPAVVLRGPDGRWYAFGNRGVRRDKQPRKVTVLRGGGVN